MLEDLVNISASDVDFSAGWHGCTRPLLLVLTAVILIGSLGNWVVLYASLSHNALKLGPLPRTAVQVRHFSNSFQPIVINFFISWTFYNFEP